MPLSVRRAKEERSESIMPRWFATIVLLVSPLTLVAGCGWIAPPTWFHPGPAPYQRQGAVDYDPYPLNDIGPPVVGGRPRGFQAPHSEVKRARPRTGANPWSSYHR